MNVAPWPVLLLGVLAACDPSDGKSTETDPVDTDVVDTDGSETDVVDTDGADTDTPGAVPTACTVETTMAELTSRDTASLTVTATDASGTAWDATDAASFESSAPEVAGVFAGSTVQPTGEGTATLSADVGGVTCTVEVSVTVVAAAPGDLVINELLVDPDGDPNRDGASDSQDDEFIEIANRSDVTVDLSGVTIVERDFAALPRHTFADGLVLRAGEAVVVFGGGSVDGLTADNARFFVAENQDAGLLWGLNLSDSGDVVRVVAADGTTIDSLAYGDQDSTGTVPAPTAESIVLDTDVFGTSYVAHTSVSVSDQSAGTQLDGSPFDGYMARYSP